MVEGAAGDWYFDIRRANRRSRRLRRSAYVYISQMDTVDPGGGFDRDYRRQYRAGSAVSLKWPNALADPLAEPKKSTAQAIDLFGLDEESVSARSPIKTIG
jgi:hypothetical protein